jgi:hypothetical protein
MPVDSELVKAKIETCPGEGDISLDVYFNPKEIQIDKTVPWTEHAKTEGNEPTLEFTNAKPKNLTVELMFDGFEDEVDVHKKYVSKLERMTMVDETKKRPPNLTFTFGSMPVFKGVIASLGVKYTLFMPDGTPVRATVTVKMTQAAKLMNKKEAEDAAKAEQQAARGTQANAGNSRRMDSVAAQNGTNHRTVGNNSGLDNLDGVPPGTNLRTGGGR